MKTYLLALECRLNNEGIFFEDGEYLERVAKIKQVATVGIQDDNVDNTKVNTQSNEINNIPEK